MLRTIAATTSAVAISAGVAEAATVVTPDATPTLEQAAIVKMALDPDMRNAPFTVGLADLNDDGKPDIVIHFTSSMWCGSHGCSGNAVLSTPQGYARRSIVLGIFYKRLTVLDSAHNGLHDLRFDDGRYILKWDGRLQYR